ncbi:MAG: hypothetical protein AB9921_06610 [Erysipelotrichaceae bacterium]
MISVVKAGGRVELKNYKFIRYLPIFPVMIPVIFIMLFAVVYPKEIDAQNVMSSLTITEKEINIKLDYIYSFEKFYDYHVEYENNILKIYVRRSAFIGEKWPLIIEIENKYQDLKEVRLIGKNEPQTIYIK